MPYNLEDVVQVTVSGFMNLVPWANVMTFEVTSPLPDFSEAAMVDWLDQLVDERYTQGAANLAPVFSVTRAEALNLTDELTYNENAYNITGTNADVEAQPSFVTAGVKKIRGSRLTRSGSMRWGGFSESQIKGNAFISGAYDPISLFISDWEPLVAVDFNGDSFGLTERIVARWTIQEVADGLAPVGTKAGSYNLNKVNTILGYSVRREVSSQVSRKIY